MKKHLSIMVMCTSLPCYASETKNSPLTPPSKPTQLTKEYRKKITPVDQRRLSGNNNVSKLDIADTSSQTSITPHKGTLVTVVQNSPLGEEERNRLAMIKEFEDAEGRIRMSRFGPLNNSPYGTKKSFSNPITPLTSISEVDEND